MPRPTGGGPHELQLELADLLGAVRRRQGHLDADHHPRARLVDRDRKSEARTMLERAIAEPLDPDWAPEDEAFQQQARELLKTIK